jgi:hypothetical protein
MKQGVLSKQTGPPPNRILWNYVSPTVNRMGTVFLGLDELGEDLSYPNPRRSS